MKKKEMKEVIQSLIRAEKTAQESMRHFRRAEELRETYNEIHDAFRQSLSDVEKLRVENNEMQDTLNRIERLLRTPQPEGTPCAEYLETIRDIFNEVKP